MHMGNVACLVLCLQLWLATSYSEVTPKHNDVACEGGTGEFPSTNNTKPLLKVEYFFQNKIIAKSSSPNLSSVQYKDEKLKSRLLIDGNVAFRIEHVTEKDRGEYKIVLTDIYGDRRELVWSLDVTVPGSGKLNITSETNSSNVFRCGEQTGSDLYAWVLINATDVHRRNTKESELTLGDLNQNWSFYCIRLSDCQRSPWFNFTWDSSSQTKPVSCCQGGTASFPWTDEIHPFRSIEWYFENTQLAKTSESSFSQESLIIDEIYKDRFHLHKPGNAGFNLTKVVKTDEGIYRCIITLQSTGLEFDWKLRVEGERTTITAPTPTGERTTITAPTPTGNTIIVVGVLILCFVIALLLGVLGFLYWRRKKRNSNQITRDSEASTPMT